VRAVFISATTDEKLGYNPPKSLIYPAALSTFKKALYFSDNKLANIGRSAGLSQKNVNSNLPESLLHPIALPSYFSSVVLPTFSRLLSIGVYGSMSLLLEYGILTLVDTLKKRNKPEDLAYAIACGLLIHVGICIVVAGIKECGDTIKAFYATKEQYLEAKIIQDREEQKHTVLREAYASIAAALNPSHDVPNKESAEGSSHPQKSWTHKILPCLKRNTPTNKVAEMSAGK
jgi:hypothetical protein